MDGIAALPEHSVQSKLNRSLMPPQSTSLCTSARDGVPEGNKHAASGQGTASRLLAEGKSLVKTEIAMREKSWVFCREATVGRSCSCALPSCMRKDRERPVYWPFRRVFRVSPRRPAARYICIGATGGTPLPPPVRRAAGARRARYDGLRHVQNGPHWRCNFSEYTRRCDFQKGPRFRSACTPPAAREARGRRAGRPVIWVFQRSPKRSTFEMGVHPLRRS